MGESVALYLIIRFFQEAFGFTVYLSYILFPRKLQSRYKKILLLQFTYYKNLEPAKKKLFEHRMKLFMRTKKFIPEFIDKVSDEMKVLISASAVQLTFGLQVYKLIHYRRIIVTPKEYRHKATKRVFKGHVDGLGRIYLSWNNFKEGYDIEHDGINLGLHEMAHALRRELLRKDFNFEFFHSYENYEQLAKIEMQRVKDKLNTILRPYSGKNLDEFFSVCIEYFFEAPLLFHSRLPEIYNRLKKLLKQDPRNEANPLQY